MKNSLAEIFLINLGTALFCGLLWSGICILALGGNFATEPPIFALYNIIKEYPLESFMCWHVMSALCVTFISYNSNRKGEGQCI